MFVGRQPELSGPQFIALIGHDLNRYLLPRLQEAEARALGIDLKVDLLDPLSMARARPHLTEMLSMLPMLGFAGACIASPYKRAAVEHVDGLSLAAQATGAVTTVVFRDGMRLGHNASAWAVRESLRRSLGEVGPGPVLLLGAGSTGAAVGFALQQLGTNEVLIHDPRAERAEQLAATLKATVVTDLAAAADRAQGIINASPVGSARHPGCAIDTDLLRPAQWVADVVEDPIETSLIRAARARHCRTVDGSAMAVFRAVRDLHLLTGRPADTERIRQSADCLRHATPI
ncbi:hypothetical protein ATO3_07805 [Marinibacterium profundimaris]|uniref:Shikimate dehydrogenase substrate binding N-terminal domain-containing protein n=1 Tax=Marinibacterium profundimaris TaxID=1679460 RepID=A0A225NT19_9RHOB|nr:hypothetical protein ATO3_07805 [Marinibacterium profundimaris]